MKTNRVVVFSCRLFPNILKYKDYQWDLPTILKQDSFRHMLRSSASMYEGSDSQFFRSTTEVQSGPAAFDKSRFAVIFLTILGLTEILCSFRLVLEEKAGKEIPESSRLEFSEKFLVSTYQMQKTPPTGHLPLWKTLLAIPQMS